jgi:hypothetical protein
MNVRVIAKVEINSVYLEKKIAYERKEMLLYIGFFFVPLGETKV